MTNKQTTNTIVLAAGGTGGHVFPAAALSDELRALKYKPVFITDDRGQEYQGALAKIPIHYINAASPSGKNPFKIIGALFKLYAGYRQARKLYKTLKPTVVVGFGGYPSVPALLAAQRMGIKTIVHDQNAVFGKANRMIARKANVIATSFPEIANIKPNKKQQVIYTGNPVRPAIAKIHDTEKRIFSRTSSINILVTGGSQGAQILGDVVPQAIAFLNEKLRGRLRIIQQARAEQVPELQNQYDKIGVKAHVMSFVDDMPKELKKTHIAICRAGGSTVAEMACTGTPTIFIPLPSATDDHQSKNTEQLVRAGGGWMMPQLTLRPTTLADRLTTLLKSPEMIASASHKAKSCSMPDAHKTLANIVQNMVQDSHGIAPSTALDSNTTLKEKS